MPVEGSDIVQTAMDTGDDDSTGCEEEVLRSDDHVRKITQRTRGLRFPTKSTLRIRNPRGSRGNQDKYITLACNDGQKSAAVFPQLQDFCSGKRRNKSFLPFTFLMRVSIACARLNRSM
jgi:hypothetical protein